MALEKGKFQPATPEEQDAYQDGEQAGYTRSYAPKKKEFQWCPYDNRTRIGKAWWAGFVAGDSRRCAEKQAQSAAVSPLESAWRDLHHASHLLRAIEVAFAGNHSLLVIGHPDAGYRPFSSLCRLLHQQFSCMHFINMRNGGWSWKLPCPCGYCGDPAKDCLCSVDRVQRWRRRLERQDYDLTILVQVPTSRTLTEVDRARAGKCEPSSAVVERVQALSASALAAIPLTLDPAGRSLFAAATDKLHLSLDARDRAGKVARTIAGLAGSPSIRAAHLAEALAYTYQAGRM